MKIWYNSVTIQTQYGTNVSPYSQYICSLVFHRGFYISMQKEEKEDISQFLKRNFWDDYAQT